MAASVGRNRWPCGHCGTGLVNSRYNGEREATSGFEEEDGKTISKNKDERRGEDTDKSERLTSFPRGSLC